MSSYYYWLAFNDLSDAFWACWYGITTHPLYGLCAICPSFSRCTSPLKEANLLRATLDEPIKVTITIKEEDDE
ncbi:MAG: hypothetical protein IJG33_00120 [Selenomonadaceae bacterium]|nr:hypothetical protein [Selenomonadaceae bacterium]